VGRLKLMMGLSVDTWGAAAQPVAATTAGSRTPTEFLKENRTTDQ